MKTVIFFMLFLRDYEDDIFVSGHKLHSRSRMHDFEDDIFQAVHSDIVATDVQQDEIE